MRDVAVPQAGFVPPPYPHDRLDAFRRLAAVVPGGIVDCSIGNPVDPVPDFVLAALDAAAPRCDGLSAHHRVAPTSRGAAAGWIDRRLGVDGRRRTHVARVHRHEGDGRFAARGCCGCAIPSRDTVLYPAISYPTYAMGAELAGLRAVPVPLDADWHLDLARVRDEDADRALLLWTNEPGNPTAAVAIAGAGRRDGGVGPRARHRGRRRRVLRRVLRRRPDDRARHRRRRRAGGALAVEALEHGGLPGRVRRRRPGPRAVPR